MRKLRINALSQKDFATFGDVLETQVTPTVVINQGNCERFSDIAKLDFGDGRAGISIFNAKPYSLPYTLAMMERHPAGSQAFLPLSSQPYLVIVAEDNAGAPDIPHVFITNGLQGVNYHRNVWHGVLCPLANPAIFAVVDRIGEGANLQEHWFDTPYCISAGRD